MSERNRRYVAVFDGMLGHPIVGARAKRRPAKNPKQPHHSTLEAWLSILFSAAWKRHLHDRANGQTIDFDVGEFLAGRSYWADKWNWGEQSVRGFFSQLEANGMVEFSNRGSNQSIAVGMVSNYSRYQRSNGKLQPEYQPEQQPKPNQSATRVQPECNQSATTQYQRHQGYQEHQEHQEHQIKNPPPIPPARPANSTGRGGSALMIVKRTSRRVNRCG